MVAWVTGLTGLWQTKLSCGEFLVVMFSEHDQEEAAGRPELQSRPVLRDSSLALMWELRTTQKGPGQPSGSDNGPPVYISLHPEAQTQVPAPPDPCGSVPLLAWGMKKPREQVKHMYVCVCVCG